MVKGGKGGRGKSRRGVKGEETLASVRDVRGEGRTLTYVRGGRGEGREGRKFLSLCVGGGGGWKSWKGGGNLRLWGKYW